jgi:hypothetical protein
MSEFVLVWVLITTYHGAQYSPPVKTLEDCQRMQAMVSKNSSAGTQCVQINILKKASER